MFSVLYCKILIFLLLCTMLRMLPIQQCIMGFFLFFSCFTQSYKRQDWTPLHVKTAAHVSHWPAKEVDFMQNLKKGMGPQMKPVRHHANK